MLALAPMVEHHLISRASRVEAWTDRLPYCGAKPKSRLLRQQDYHQELCAAIRNLAPSVASVGGLHASWTTERREERHPDTENILIWDVSSALPHVTQFLRFERHIGALPSPPESLQFQPGHHLRYEAVRPPQASSSSYILADAVR